MFSMLIKKPEEKDLIFDNVDSNVCFKLSLTGLRGHD